MRGGKSLWFSGGKSLFAGLVRGPGTRAWYTGLVHVHGPGTRVLYTGLVHGPWARALYTSLVRSKANYVCSFFHFFLIVRCCVFLSQLYQKLESRVPALDLLIQTPCQAKMAPRDAIGGSTSSSSLTSRWSSALTSGDASLLFFM